MSGLRGAVLAAQGAGPGAGPGAAGSASPKSLAAAGLFAAALVALSPEAPETLAALAAPAAPAPRPKRTADDGGPSPELAAAALAVLIPPAAVPETLAAPVGTGCSGTASVTGAAAAASISVPETLGAGTAGGGAAVERPTPAPAPVGDVAGASEPAAGLASLSAAPAQSRPTGFPRGAAPSTPGSPPLGGGLPGLLPANGGADGLRPALPTGHREASGGRAIIATGPAPARPPATAAVPEATMPAVPAAVVGLNSPMLTAPPAPAPVPAPAGFAAQLARPLFSLAAAAPGEHVMTVHVAPENLGPVTVRAHIGTAGVRVELFAPSDAGRAAVQAVLPDLRRDLADAGIGGSLDLSSRDAPQPDGGHGQAAGGGGGGRGDHPSPAVRLETLRPARAAPHAQVTSATSLDILA